MKRFALLLGAAVVLAVGCAKKGPSLDGQWSVLVAGSDVGAQHMTFSDGKNWKMTSVFEAAGAKYTTVTGGTYKLEEDGKKLSMQTIADRSELTMEGGNEKQKKDFEAGRKTFLEQMKQRPNTGEVSDVRWFNDNSFEARYQGDVVTFHRK